MKGFKITDYRCDDLRAYVTFLADGNEYTQESGMVEGSKLHKRGDRERNRPKIQRRAIGVWLKRNHDLVSKATYVEMRKFIDSR